MNFSSISSTPLAVMPGSIDQDFYPSHLKFEGSGSFWVYSSKRVFDLKWGDKDYPHWNVKIVYPTQISPSKLESLIHGRVRLIKVCISETGDASLIRQNPFPGEIDPKYIFSPLVISWRKHDKYNSKEYHQIKFAKFDVTDDLSDLKRMASIGNYVGLMKLDVQLGKEVSNISVVRGLKPGDRIELEHPQDDFGRYKYTLQVEKKQNIERFLCIESVCKRENAVFCDVRVKTFLDKMSPMLLWGLSYASMQSCLQALHLESIVSNMLLKGGVNLGISELNRGKPEERKRLLSDLRNEFKIRFYDVNEEETDMLEDAASVRIVFDNANSYEITSVPGTLSLPERLRRTRYILDIKHSTDDPDKLVRRGIAYSALDQHLESISWAEGFGSITEHRRNIFAHWDLYAEDSQCYLSYCEKRIEFILDQISGPGGYLDYFWKQSLIGDLNTMYSNNIPSDLVKWYEKRGIIKDIFASKKPSFLIDAIAEYNKNDEYRPSYYELLVDLRNLFEYVKTLKAEAKEYLEILSDIAVDRDEQLFEINLTYLEYEEYIKMVEVEFSKLKL